MRFTVALPLVALCSCSPAPELASAPDADRIYAADCPKPPETSGPDTYDAIYNELLGPKSAAQCQNPACHGGSSEQGGLKMKNTKDEAYQGMRDYGLLFPNPDAGMVTEDPPPSVAGLVRVVIPLASTGKPKMPRELCGNRFLSAAEIERIKRWGKAGAPNN